MHKNNNMMLIFYRKSVESPDYSYTYSDIKITVKHEKTSAEFLLLRFLWCHRESNQGHKDFQSFALPTELWHQIFLQNFPIFRLGLQR